MLCPRAYIKITQLFIFKLRIVLSTRRAFHVSISSLLSCLMSLPPVKLLSFQDGTMRLKIIKYDKLMTTELVLGSCSVNL